MLHLLRVEWLKVKNYRTFWILLAMTILSIPGLNYLIFWIRQNSIPKGGQAAFADVFSFPEVWHVISWNSATLFTIPAILIITLTSNEFTFKTHRQNVIDGWSRRQFVSVKIFELVLLALLNTLIVLLTVLVFGCLVSKVPPGQSVWADSRFLFFYFVEMLSYSMIAFLLALLIKRSGLAIAAFLFYMLVEEIIVDWLHHYTRGVEYLPEEVTDRLIPWPYLRKMILASDEIARWERHIPIFLVVSLVYLIVYWVVADWRFTKSDL